jgi:hypothetical protein
MYCIVQPNRESTKAKNKDISFGEKKKEMESTQQG